MKVGFWNRLSIVAGALLLLVMPFLGMIDFNRNALKAADLWRQVCLSQGEGRELEQGYSAGYQMCMDRFASELQTMRAGWGVYWEGLWMTAIGCVILYGLVWGIVWVAKWVWRGRSIHRQAIER